MVIRWPFRAKAYPLISGITGKQGVDAPETSGQWQLFSSLKSYGEANNSPPPFYTLWGAFAGAGASFATSAPNPSEPWYIGAMLVKNRKALVERVMFSPRDGANGAFVKSGSIEVASIWQEMVIWTEVARFDTESGVIDVSFQQITCIGVRIKANPLYDSTGGQHPGYSGIQIMGLL